MSSPTFSDENLKSKEFKYIPVIQEQQKEMKNGTSSRFFQLNCCGNGEKRISNEILTNGPQKEVDFRTFFANLIQKRKDSNDEKKLIAQENISDVTPRKKSDIGSFKFQDKLQTSNLKPKPSKNSFTVDKVRSRENSVNQKNEQKPNKNPFEVDKGGSRDTSKSSMDQIRNEKLKSKDRNSSQRIFQDFNDTKKAWNYVDNIDNILKTKTNKPSESISPQSQKKIDTMSPRENKSGEISMRHSLHHLSRKYLRSTNKSPQSKSDLSLGEILCINCDEFIDVEDMNDHFKICEKMPENKDLIIVNYKLEKIKTALLLNMKNETNLELGILDECLNIFLNCLQKVISSNENPTALEEVTEDLNEIWKELPCCVTSKNRVYIILLDRTKELTNLKKSLVEENFRKTRESDSSFNIRSMYPERKIFTPLPFHLPFVDQQEQFSEDYSYRTNLFQAKKNRTIFKEIKDFRQNEELLLSKPREVSHSPSTMTIINDNVKVEPSESENLARIKRFLLEKEKQRKKFDEKISRINVEGVQQFSESKDSNIFRGDLDRRRKFLELVEKLKQKTELGKNVISNTELYEECQNNQIHEHNWEGFVSQKFQNIY